MLRDKAILLVILAVIALPLFAYFAATSTGIANTVWKNNTADTIIELFCVLVGYLIASLAFWAYIKAGSMRALYLGLAFTIFSSLALPSLAFRTNSTQYLWLYLNGVLVGSLMFLVGAFTKAEVAPSLNRAAGLVSTLLMLMFFVDLFIVVSIASQDILPPLVDDGTGFTALTLIYGVLFSIFFTVSSLLYFRIYLKARSTIPLMFSLLNVFFLESAIFFVLSSEPQSGFYWLSEIFKALGFSAAFLTLFIAHTRSD